MARKKFEEINTEARLADTISKATARGGNQGLPTAEEAQLRNEAKRTKGRKGLSLAKINVAFPDLAYDFVKVVSKSSGLTMNEFIVAIVEKYMAEYPEDYQKAKELQEHLKPLIPSTFTEDEDEDE